MKNIISIFVLIACSGGNSGNTKQTENTQINQTQTNEQVYTKNFRVCHFFSQLFPAAYALRTSSKLLISSINSDTLRESANIKLVLNHTKIVSHVR